MNQNDIAVNEFLATKHSELSGESLKVALGLGGLPFLAHFGGAYRGLYSHSRETLDLLIALLPDDLKREIVDKLAESGETTVPDFNVAFPSAGVLAGIVARVLGYKGDANV